MFATEKKMLDGRDGRTVFSKEVANEEIVDDALTSSDGDVHVVGLLAEAVEVVFSLRILGLPGRLLRDPLGAIGGRGAAEKERGRGRPPLS